MKVNITISARKDISTLQGGMKKEVWVKLKQLQSGKARYKKLKNSNSYSLRVKDYRIIFNPVAFFYCKKEDIEAQQ